MKKLKSAALLSLLTACQPMMQETPVIPSLEYSKSLKEQMGQAPLKTVYLDTQGRIVRENYGQSAAQAQNARSAQPMARLHYVAGQDVSDEIITNERTAGFETFESTLRHTRDYNGPLSLGDPGVTASLWRESRGTNDIFRDQRAWQPLDLITIVVTENSEGRKEADTEVKSTSTVLAAIEQLFTIDDDLVESNPNGRIAGSPGVDPTALVNARVQNDYKGEGETTRRGSLRAKISAMVAEVLPSGILRIEGQKIISVNSEEQIMVISGLVRPRDINSQNEIDSSKVANMRIDYYGKGILAEAQVGGWLARLMRFLWPF